MPKTSRRRRTSAFRPLDDSPPRTRDNNPWRDVLLHVKTTDSMPSATGKILVSDRLVIRGGRYIHMEQGPADALRVILGARPTLRTFEVVELVNELRQRRIRGCFVSQDPGHGQGCVLRFARAEVVGGK